jgi:hypothetical protein
VTGFREVGHFVLFKAKMKTKKQKIKQQIIATLVTFFMFIMVFGVVDVKDTSAVTATMNLIQNFVSGGLSLECEQNLVFSDITIGLPTNSTANMTWLNVRDLRGTGAGWTLTAVSNNLSAVNAGLNFISNAAIAFNPAGATIIGLNGAVTTGMGQGTAAYLSAARTFINATNNNGMGNYRINNTVFNIVYSGAVNQAVGSYQATVTFELL